MLRTFFIWLGGLASALAGQDPGISIQTMDVSTAPMGGVIVEYNYDGSRGDNLLIGVHAIGGEDLSIEPDDFTYKELERGSHRISLMLYRPFSETAISTDRIEVFVCTDLRRGPAISVMRKIIKKQIDWPAARAQPPFRRHWLTGFANAYDVGDYDEAERVFDLWSTQNALDDNGDPKLVHYLKAMEDRLDADRRGSLARIRAWRLARPNSVGAVLSEAWYWVANADYLHGAQKPGADAMTIIRQYHATARKILDSNPSAGMHPLGQWLRLRMAINGEGGEKHVLAVFEAGVRAQPKNAELYIETAKALAQSNARERWEQVSRIAERLDNSISAIRPGAYAILWDRVAEATKGTTPNLFTIGVAPWSRTRDSWRALVLRYPSAVNLNRFAGRACEAGDRDAFQTALAKIGKALMPDEWPTGHSLDLCRKRYLKET